MLNKQQAHEQRGQQGQGKQRSSLLLCCEVLQGLKLFAETEQGDISQHVLLLATDATRLPFLENSFNVICADLPWGQLVGTHEQNSNLYPRFLQEAARIAMPSAKLIVLTHEIALFEHVLQGFSDVWEIEEIVKVFQGGLHPRIYALRRK